MAGVNSASSWLHFNPVKIIAGAGSLNGLGNLVLPGGRMLLVTSAGFTRRGITKRITALFGPGQIAVYDEVKPNPELDDLEQATRFFKDANIATIVALGGGSVMDAAKTLAVTLPSALAHPLKEVLRDGLQHTWTAGLPVIAIPTTSGTGAEVTPFATVWDRTTHKKHSIVGENVYPRIALLDSELTLSLPRDETRNTALDSISHALESLWNKNRTPVSALYARRALSLACEALPVILNQPDNLNMRSMMQHASLFAGLAISQTRTAIAHSISYPITSHFNVPHGLACSFTLPAILRSYIQEPGIEKEELLLLQRVLELLESLKMGKILAEYATREQIIQLQSQMYTKGRADNFAGKIPDLSELLIKSTD